MYRSELGKKQQTWRVFSLRELHAATNNFNYDNKLGEGGFGSVYWGQLWDGSQVMNPFLSFCLNFLLWILLIVCWLCNCKTVILSQKIQLLCCWYMCKIHIENEYLKSVGFDWFNFRFWICLFYYELYYLIVLCSTYGSLSPPFLLVLNIESWSIAN